MILSPWIARADALAAWAWSHLVNRCDCWGGYRPPEDWGREFRRQDNTTGKLGQTTTNKGQLTPEILVRHFRACGRADVIGLHSTSPENTCRWGALDVDHHGPTSTSPEVNLRAALAWYERLVKEGHHPLLLDSNGKGGYHLWVLLESPIPTPRVYHFLHSLISNQASHGMAQPPEVFPKQPELRQRPDKGPSYGNWLRVPGRHHTRDHWAKVWDGAGWLVGAQAVAFILGLDGSSPVLLPDVPVVEPIPRCVPATAWYCGGCNRAARAAAYMRQLPNLGEGQGRDDVAYQFACFLTRDLALSDAVALLWLERWDAGNAPPKGTPRLKEILSSASAYGRNSVGCGLGQTPLRKSGHHHTMITLTLEVP